MTNADRIRAMTDEELAEWFCDNVSCDCGCLANDCKACWFDFLKQEATEE